MGSIWIREFTGGLDTRRLPETSKGGTLLRATDCHINKGGEIEQRAEFHLVYTSPLNESVGLASTASDLVVFGHAASAPADLPASFEYQQLAHPSGEALTEIPAWEPFGAEMAAVGEFIDGSRHVFLAETRVSDANAPPNLSGSGSPRALLTQHAKLNVGAGPAVFFSAIRDGDDFSGTGAGFIDMSFDLGEWTDVRSIAAYDTRTAVFFPDAVSIWQFDPDPGESLSVQQLRGIGTFADRSVVPFYDGDLLFLHTSGIRSLRARDSSRALTVNDIGTAVDTFVQATLAEADDTARARASAVVEPLTGRIWVALLDQIFVLSFYPEAKISAWTIYQPGFTVDYLTTFNDRVYLRSGDDIYVYGSETGPYQYSADVEAEAWLPYLDGDHPAQAKRFRGVDAAVRGEWEIRAGLDPDNLDAYDKIATISKSTFGGARIAYDAEATHISLRAVCHAPKSATEPAIFSSAVIHHDLDADEDN